MTSPGSCCLFFEFEFQSMSDQNGDWLALSSSANISELDAEGDYFSKKILKLNCTCAR